MSTPREYFSPAELLPILGFDDYLAFVMDDEDEDKDEDENPVQESACKVAGSVGDGTNNVDAEIVTNSEEAGQLLGEGTVTENVDKVKVNTKWGQLKRVNIYTALDSAAEIKAQLDKYSETSLVRVCNLNGSSDGEPTSSSSSSPSDAQSPGNVNAGSVREKFNERQIEKDED